MQIVTVDDADVGEPQLLEEHARDQERLHRLLDVLAEAVRPFADSGNAGQTVLEILTQAA